MNKKSLLACCSAGLMISGAVGAAEKQTMIVFDASGSMWGQIDGKAKITLAREAMADISGQFQADDAIGLIAYGHRRKGDCGDIELMVPVGQNTAQSLVETVNNIKPKGKTPIGQALSMATETLKIAEQAAEVVLISDGLETCDLDPCQVAEDAESLGIDFTAHVIGFGLTADEGKQLSCVAQATGGQYLQAQDADSLTVALNQVLKAEQSEPPADVLPEARVIAPEVAPTIGSGFQVSWTGPNGKDDYIDVVKVGYEKVHGELSYAWTKNGEPSTMKAPGEAGIYQLRYIWQGSRQKHVLTTVDFEVKDSDVSLLAPASVNMGEVFDVSWGGPGEAGDYIDLVTKGYAETSREIDYFYTKVGSTGSLNAPGQPGDYEIRYVIDAPDGRKVLHQIPLKVQAVKTTLAAPPSVNVGENIEVFWTGPGGELDYIDLVKKDFKNTSGELSYFYTKIGSSGTLLSPGQSGDYEIRYVMDSSDGRRVLYKQPLTVTAEEATLLAPEAVYIGQKFEVTWKGPVTSGSYIDLVKTGEQRTSGEFSYFYLAKSAEKGQLIAHVLPGSYEVRYILDSSDGRRVLAKQTLEILPVNVVLEAPDQAAINSQLSIKWEGPNRDGDYIDRTKKVLNRYWAQQCIDYR